ncbi:Tubulin-tyrosine ligase family protein [Tritrichomonas foetus]|uniref:Tubulin-tyrosine ligase family protein n=1 Tax=Tritrichomonas foetus TaxID=1144522 RepID=A0A1J4K6Z4_9EUKA|nr:Tubulin-tyrosine ligase family protein [Tritrichomonas foetus]|eukprot:OHT07143.1 Tubulin-tyrosine ligase family protein [Tritrichomonas foetus]
MQSESYRKICDSFPYPVDFYSFFQEPSQVKHANEPMFFISGFTAKLVRTTLENSGFKETDDLSNASIVVGNKNNEDTQNYLKNFQRMTHFLYTFSIGRKIGLHITLSRFKQQTNLPLNFYPKTFLLPDQIDQFKKEFSSSKYWIEKPTSGSCGRGIRVIDEIPEKFIAPKVIMQEYIPNPLLINGYKFDLRFYVAVTSLNPLRLYNYDDGLVRLATDKYFEHFNEISNLSAHLTNFTVNKENSQFKITDDIKNDGKGSKWSHKPFWPFLDSLLYDVDDIKNKIDDAIATIFISARDQLAQQKNHRCSFELYGVDVLLTVDGEIHILEVNISPALGTSSALDRHIKAPLVKDFFNISLIPTHTEIVDKFEESFNDSKLNDVSEFISICEYELAEERRGKFRRIYPTIERVKTFGQFLEKKTNLDKALEEWVMADKIQKEKILASKIPKLQEYLGDLFEFPQNSCLLI